MLFAIIAGLVVIGLIMWLLLRRRSSGPEEVVQYVEPEFKEWKITDPKKYYTEDVKPPNVTGLPKKDPEENMFDFPWEPKAKIIQEVKQIAAPNGYTWGVSYAKKAIRKDSMQHRRFPHITEDVLLVLSLADKATGSVKQSYQKSVLFVDTTATWSYYKTMYSALHHDEIQRFVRGFTNWAKQQRVYNVDHIDTQIEYI
ncbi:hypothetical protein SEA_NICEHOUSE_230 [Rhodococcus phage NiceHouse]|nr:hypothetical protein SEA_NICEHOUSE_230 [Rhodococcus phage NiceHouse]